MVHAGSTSDVSMSDTFSTQASACWALQSNCLPCFEDPTSHRSGAHKRTAHVVVCRLDDILSPSHLVELLILCPVDAEAGASQVIVTFADLLADTVATVLALGQGPSRTCRTFPAWGWGSAYIDSRWQVLRTAKPSASLANLLELLKDCAA